MDSKRFIAELQKRSGLDRSRLRSLLKALGEVIRLRAMALDPLDIVGLGRFEGRKRMEFEYEERDSGRTLLYPPHIGLRFTAAPELTEGDGPSLETLVGKNTWLKRQVAELAQTEPAFATVCIDALIRIASDTIRMGEEVEIAGIGVMRVVSTGRTQQRRVVCTIAPELREEVNAPFAGFDPVVIRVREQEPITPPVVTTLAGGVEASPETYMMEDPDMKQNPDTTPDERTPDATNQADDKPYPDAMQPAEADAYAAAADAPMSQHVEPVADADDADAVATTGSRRSVTIAVIVLLAVAILGTGIYFAYRVSQSEKAAEAAGSSTVTVISQAPAQAAGAAVATPDTLAMTSADSAKQIPEAMAGEQPASASASAAETTSTTDRDAGFPKTVELQSGERLTLLAMRYYGSKFFWVYIYEANKARYADPDNIPAGAMLTIPAPSQYGIDANDSSSVNRAKELSASVIW